VSKIKKVDELSITHVVCAAMLLLMISVTGVSAQTPFQCRGQYYLTKLVVGDTSEFSRIFNVRIVDRSGQVFFDPIPGNVDEIFVNAMGYRITDNLLYMIQHEGEGEFNLIRTGSDGALYRLKGLPELGGTAVYHAGACTPDGRYLVVARTPNERRLIPGIGPVDNFGFNDVLYFIDLTDPTYPVRELSLDNDRFAFADMAFDPFTGLCYAYDEVEQRLIQIDIDDGTVSPAGAPDQTATVMGSMFFDASGRLYGYGDNIATLDDDQATLFSLNKNTGQVTPLVDAEPVAASDGCSCPYTVDMLKAVTPGRALSCQDVTYTFTISNASAIDRAGLTLRDTLPEGMRFGEILSNGFGGDLIVSDDGRVIAMENITVPLGIDSLSILVEIEQGVSGLLVNQASLVGLPDSLGARIRSDDPTTLAVDDPTILQVIDLDFDLAAQNAMLCMGDTLTLQVEDLRADYIWSDGTVGPRLQVTEPGRYGLMASTVCEEFSDEVEVVFHPEVEAEIVSSAELIKLGDSVQLEALITPMSNYDLIWLRDQDTLAGPCSDCALIFDQPFFPGQYYLTVQDIETTCRDIDSSAITVDRSLGVWAPNAFTPNGDGTNESFFLVGICPYPISTFEIFNRWGDRMYRIDDIEVNDEVSGWDGMSGGVEVNPAVFVWKAVFERPDGSRIIRTGDVTLIR